MATRKAPIRIPASVAAVTSRAVAGPTAAAIITQGIARPTVPAVVSQGIAAPVAPKVVQTGVSVGPNVPVTSGPMAQAPSAPMSSAVPTPFTPVPLSVPPAVEATAMVPSTPSPSAPMVPVPAAMAPNAPIQAAPLSDDSAQWHDPAPAAVAAALPSSTQTAAAAIPGLPATASTALATTPAAVVKPSLWTRFWTWLGFIKPPATTATVHGDTPVTIEDAARSIVHRIRNGDQNAMALAIMIGDNARKGNPIAQRSYLLMENYIHQSNQSNHAGEERLDHTRINSGWGRAVYLANGPHISNERLADATSSFGAEGGAFVSGILLPTYPAVSEAHHHGKVVGMARKLQAVRMPNSRISDYSPTVGWELGE